MSTPSPTPRKITYLATTPAYDRWAATYDHDFNPLQALDDLCLPPLLAEFLALLPAPSPAHPTTIVDLGCGTGRNTLKLLSVQPAPSQVVGLDASRAMLAVARRRCTEQGAATTGPGAAVELVEFDMLERGGAAVPACARGASGVVSTLVLEHVPLRVFFAMTAAMVEKGGALLVSNMHAEMGARSQAGFVDPETGEKVRPQSYVYDVEEVVEEAKRWGWRVVSEVRERAVERGDVQVLGPRAEKWVGVKCWFGGVFKKVSAAGAEKTTGP